MSITMDATRCRLCATVTFVALLAFSIPVLAHHSVVGQFDVSKSVTLKGTISKVDWINPHVYIFLQVKEANGRSIAWGLSTIPIAMLRKGGITKESLRGQPGEVVTVTVNPAFNGKPLGWITRITYTDGRFYALFE